MRLRFVKSLCASSAVHGAAVLAALGLWAFPRVMAQGRSQRDFQLEYARVEFATAPPPAPPAEPLEDLPEPEPEESVPETVEVAPPVEPPPEPTFAPADLTPSPAETLIRPFEPPRERESQPEVLREVQPTPVQATEEPPAQPPVGDPEPVDSAPVALHNPRPRYPRRAAEREIEGEVLCELLVGADGAVREVVILESSGNALLDRAAKRGLEAWRFEPGTRDGVAVEMRIPWRLRFSLDG